MANINPISCDKQWTFSNLEYVLHKMWSVSIVGYQNYVLETHFISDKVIIYEPIGSIVLWCIIQQNKTTSVAETVSFDLETHLFISDVKFFIVVDL